MTIKMDTLVLSQQLLSFQILAQRQSTKEA
jgi:hypothetical protein